MIQIDTMDTNEMEKPYNTTSQSLAVSPPVLVSSESSDHGSIQRDCGLDVIMHEEEGDVARKSGEIIEESNVVQVSVQNFEDEEVVELDSAGEEDIEPKVEDDEGYGSGDDIDDEGQAGSDSTLEELSNMEKKSQAGSDSNSDDHEIENKVSGGLVYATGNQRDENSLKLTSSCEESIEDRIPHHRILLNSAWKDVAQVFDGTGYYLQHRKGVEMTQGTAPSPSNGPLEHLRGATQAASAGDLDVKRLLMVLYTLEQTTNQVMKELERQPEAINAEVERRLHLIQWKGMHDARYRTTMATARPDDEDMNAVKEEINTEMNGRVPLRPSYRNGPSTFRPVVEGKSARGLIGRLEYSTKRQLEKKVAQLAWEIVEKEKRHEQLTNMSPTFEPQVTLVAMRAREARARREAQIIAADPYIMDRESFKKAAEAEINLKTTKYPRYLTQKGAVREMVEGNLSKAVIASLRKDQRLAAEEEVERLTEIIMKKRERTREIHRAAQVSGLNTEAKHDETNDAYWTAEDEDAKDMSLKTSAISDSNEPETTEDNDNGRPSKRSKTLAQVGQKRKRPTPKVMRNMPGNLH